MENAAEALKMAGSVLLFIIALSIAILAFSQTREAIDAVLKYLDREYWTMEGDDRFYYLADGNDTERYVGLETIIPTIYRAYNESYKIIFKDFPDDYCLYMDTSKNKKICKIGSDDETGISDSVDFLNGIVYGKFEPSKNNFYNTKSESGQAIQRRLPEKSLYNYLEEKLKKDNYKIKETLGTYYQQDVNKNPEYTGENPSEEVSDVNRQERRVITYTFEKF